MAKKKAAAHSVYRVRVVYGFEKKLKIVLLGELESGKVKDGMSVQVALAGGSVVGDWEIIEVLHTSFINQFENPNFKGLMIKCKNLEEFELLQSLRVYDETIYLIEK